MGESNTIYQLQNYVVGVSLKGLTLDAEGRLDLDKSFTRLNYFDLLSRQTVRSNVQPKVSDRPVDFVATRIPATAISDSVSGDLETNEDPIWLSAASGKQALLLSRSHSDGESYRYLPIGGLNEDPSGKITFVRKKWDAGYPLKIFEDDNLAIPPSARLEWLNEWHSEHEWLEAVHKTLYSNAVIGLNEQMDRHPVSTDDEKGLTPDELLIRRFRQRQRRLVEADLLILANNHWNFDVRGFNPGGNHGSFFRVSTNSTFMIAGGASTGIPRGVVVQEPYDGLSFAPTILSLMGKIDDHNNPVPELYERGFRHFPGRVVKEIVNGTSAGKGN